MVISSAPLKLRRLRRRFGISAPRLAIRTHVAWYWKAMWAVLFLSILLVLAAWVFSEGARLAGFHSDESSREVSSLRDRAKGLDSELARLRGLVGIAESNLQMERATQKQLEWQVKALEAENAALKEDLAFFEGLMPASEGADDSGVRIDHLRIEPDGVADRYRYRMLVINNAGRQAKELKGVLQLFVKVRQDGKDVMLNVPSSTERDSQHFRFEIKHFLRLEGVFDVPRGVLVKDVEVRLLQDGVVRARQSVTL